MQGKPLQQKLKIISLSSLVSFASVKIQALCLLMVQVVYVMHVYLFRFVVSCDAREPAFFIMLTANCSGNKIC